MQKSGRTHLTATLLYSTDLGVLYSIALKETHALVYLEDYRQMPTPPSPRGANDIWLRPRQHRRPLPEVPGLDIAGIAIVSRLA